MFLLVPVRHVGAHPGEHQHGWQLAGAIHGDRSFRQRVVTFANVLLRRLPFKNVRSFR